MTSNKCHELSGNLNKVEWKLYILAITPRTCSQNIPKYSPKMHVSVPSCAIRLTLLTVNIVGYPRYTRYLRGGFASVKPPLPLQVPWLKVDLNSGLLMHYLPHLTPHIHIKSAKEWNRVNKKILLS